MMVAAPEPVFDSGSVLPIAASQANAAKPTFEQQLRGAAEQLVATAFISPILAESRDSPFKSEMFHGGQAEDIFGQQLDTILSERISTAAGFSLTDAIVSQFSKQPNALSNAGVIDLHG
jgi:Rod binding domain-containing protein